MTDINERAKEQWKEMTTGADRVESIVEQTYDPASADEIAEQALVSEPTARKYLTQFVDHDVAIAIQDGRTTRYKRNERTLLDTRIREVQREHTREELIAGMRRLKEELQGYRETYETDSPEELARRLGPDEEGWRDISRWRSTQKDLAIAQAALSYDEAYRLVEA
jgi:DNA-binding transcriptional ArsR family regulator